MDSYSLISRLLSALLLTSIAWWLPAQASPDLSEFNLVFSDEFNSSELDAGKWNTGLLWGPYLQINNEQQLYVDTLGINQNHVQANGGQTPSPFEMTGSSLKIIATPVNDPNEIPPRPAENAPVWNNYPEYRYNGDDPADPNDTFYDPADVDYLSGVITSYDAFRFTHGYAEARVKLPEGQGLWPAFWLLTSFYVEDVPEIDIMEFLGHDPNTVYNTYHYFEPHNGWNQVSTPSFATTGPDFTDGWHTFGVSWDPKEIVWYINGVESRRISDADYTVPNQAMYVIANLAVGGNWPGAADDTTPFPAEYELDYIRVYQKDTPETITQSVLASDYHLMFEDNFNGNTLDTSKWNTHHLWGPYWQINNEEQFYPDVSDTHAGETYESPPISVSNGTLKITADTIEPSDLPAMPSNTSDAFLGHPEWRHNDAYNNPGFSNPTNDPAQAPVAFLPEYTSGIITTYDSFKFTHGYAEIRAKLPKGDGLWPAFWLLNGYYVDQQPEIDVIETRGENPNELVHSYHLSPRDGGPPSYTWSTFSDHPDGFSDGFHTYGVAWEPGKIDYYVDGVKRHTHTGPSVSSQNMYAILNLAVGGNFNFQQVESSLFPINFEIEYVRIYQSNITLNPIVDNIDPVTTNLRPSNNSTISASDSVSISGQSNDDSGIERALLRIQRKGTSPPEYWSGTDWDTTPAWLVSDLQSDGSWTLGNLDLSLEGSYRVHLSVKDNAGNIAGAAESPRLDFDVVDLDSTDPVTTFFSPSNNSTIPASDSVSISGQSIDDSGIERALLRIQRKGTSPLEYWSGTDWDTTPVWLVSDLQSDGSWTLDKLDFSLPGSYRIHLSVKDLAGNIAGATESPRLDFDVVEFDNIDPVTTILSPINNSTIVASDSVSISGQSIDKSGVERALLRIQRKGTSPLEYWNGINWDTNPVWLVSNLQSDGFWILDNLDFSLPGSYRVHISVKDRAGNIAGATESPRLDIIVKP